MVRFLSLTVLLANALSVSLTTLNSPLTAAESINLVQPSAADRGDDWIVCTRHLPTPENQHRVCDAMRFWRRDGGTWKLSDAGQFLATLPPTTTVCVFVDGNRIEAKEADFRGKIVRRKLNCCQTNVRLVNWSWPSDQIPGRPVRDARAKISRANGDAYYLASFLAHLPDGQRTSLIGYSLGSRTVSGGIHILEGGIFSSNSIGGIASPVNPRVLFLAATVPHHWIQPGGANERFLLGAEKVLSVYNSDDKVLRLFKYDRSSDGGVVLGYRPMTEKKLGPIAPIVEQVDVASLIQKNHGLQFYVDAVGEKTICNFVAGDRR